MLPLVPKITAHGESGTGTGLRATNTPGLQHLLASRTADHARDDGRSAAVGGHRFLVSGVVRLNLEIGGELVEPPRLVDHCLF